MKIPYLKGGFSHSLFNKKEDFRIGVLAAVGGMTKLYMYYIIINNECHEQHQYYKSYILYYNLYLM